MTLAASDPVPRLNDTKKPSLGWRLRVVVVVVFLLSLFTVHGSDQNTDHKYEKALFHVVYDTIPIFADRCYYCM